MNKVTESSTHIVDVALTKALNRRLQTLPVNRGPCLSAKQSRAGEQLQTLTTQEYCCVAAFDTARAFGAS